MLLRSSSTPLLQTHFSDSPNKDFATKNHCTTKVSASPGVYHHQPHLSSFSCDSSPISHTTSGFSEFNPNTTSFRRNPFRRAQSDSNLEELASKSIDSDEFCSSKTLRRSLLKPNKSMLRTEPSFSIYNPEDGFEEENQKEDLDLGKENLVRAVRIGSGDFSFGKKGMGLIEEVEDEEEKEKDEIYNGIKNMGGIEEEVEPPSPPMYLATGFGIDGNSVGGGGGGGGGIDFSLWRYDDRGDVEEYYKRMVNEDPSNPLFLSNYAQLLQSKGDLPGAEEYYFRATLADPRDGEILLQYAKLLWELHHDQDRALSYFECAARAAPEDSHVLAAYASFLWEIDEDSDKDFAHNDHIQSEEDEGLVELQKTGFEEEKRPVSPPLHLAAGLGIDEAGFGGAVDYSAQVSREGGNVEEYYKRMVEENPCNPLFLRNYAQFLCQSNGDLEGAEEYYSRAIAADPGDGDAISQYAKLVWELHHDQDKALCYFERAVQATPGDSHVLAAYAGFLWETEEDEDDIRVPVFQGQVSACVDA